MPSRSPLSDLWKVPPVFRQRLRESVGRQRAMVAEDHLLLVLHGPPKVGRPERAGRFFWRAADGTWQSNVGPGIKALENHIAEFDARLDKLEQAKDRAERAKDFFPLLQEIAPLRRTARNLYETLQQARELAADDSDLIVCRDQAYAVARRAELVEVDAQRGLDCAVARRAEEQAENSHRMAACAHRLNLLAAIFFPMVTISAVFGMNLHHGLEDGDYGPWLFWLLVVGGLLIGFVIKGLLDAPHPPTEDRKHE